MQQRVQPLPVLYSFQEEIEHTGESPFCSDPQCPCHQDDALAARIIIDPVLDGLMTEEEAWRFFTGRQLVY